MSAPALKIFLSAGEASGERYGELLIEELRARCAPLGASPAFFGLGGPRMAALGFDCVVKSEDVAVMGITEIIRHIPQIYREYLRLRQSLRDRRPDVAILIDFPDINLKLAEECHKLRIPVLFFVSPQLWAWKKGRIKRVQRYVDRMLVIFPFEEPFYRERGVNATYVGHPLADLPLPSISREDFAQQNGLNPANRWIALLPGSRPKEIRLNIPEMLAAARLLDAHDPATEFLFPVAATLTTRQIHEISELLSKHGCAPGQEQHCEPGASSPSALPLRMVRDARAALFHARGSIVASGTATVEAALMGNPFVVVYRVSPLTYAIAKRVVTVPHVAMVNLIADQNPAHRLVPELIQDDFQATRIVQELEPLLADGQARSAMIEGLAAVTRKLHRQSESGTALNPAQTAISYVAAIAIETMFPGTPTPTAVKSSNTATGQ